MVELTRRNVLHAGAAVAAVTAAGGVQAAAAAPRMLDPHVHVWKHDPAFPFAEGAKVPDYDATPEMLIDLMKANGVEKTVIIQVIHYRYNNDYLAAVLKQYPQYFRGVCRVDPLDPAAPDHLSHWTELGFHGVRLSPGAGANGDWITGPLMPPLWQRCQNLGVPMTLLVPISRVPDCEKLIERYPDLTVVIDHMADCPVDQPRELEKLIALKRYPKVFVKLSHAWTLSKQPYPWMDVQAMMQRLHGAFGPERLMWATDWPIAKEKATYPERVKLFRDDVKFMTDEDRSWILSRTIERVWPFS